MAEFLSTWYGLTIFIAFDALAAIAVIAIGYRWVFKRLLDILASAVCMVVLSPVFLVLFLRGLLLRRRSGGEVKVIEREYCVGKKARAIVLHAFASGQTPEESAGQNRNKWQGIYKLPYLFDIFCGRLSFIGVRKFSFADAALVSEADEGRFAVRPGLINPLAATGDGETDYPEMFRSDLRYWKRLGLGTDLKIFFTWALRCIRGERDWLGSTSETSYAAALLEAGEITREDFEAVTANALAEEEELRKKYEAKGEESETIETDEATKEVEGNEEGPEESEESENGSGKETEDGTFVGPEKPDARRNG